MAHQQVLKYQFLSEATYSIIWNELIKNEKFTSPELPEAARNTFYQTSVTEVATANNLQRRLLNVDELKYYVRAVIVEVESKLKMFFPPKQSEMPATAGGNTTVEKKMTDEEAQRIVAEKSREYATVPVVAAASSTPIDLSNVPTNMFDVSMAQTNAAASSFTPLATNTNSIGEIINILRDISGSLRIIADKLVKEPIENGTIEIGRSA